MNIDISATSISTIYKYAPAFSSFSGAKRAAAKEKVEDGKIKRARVQCLSGRGHFSKLFL